MKIREKNVENLIEENEALEQELQRLQKENRRWVLISLLFMGFMIFRLVMYVFEHYM